MVTYVRKWKSKFQAQIYLKNKHDLNSSKYHFSNFKSTSNSQDMCEKRLFPVCVRLSGKWPQPRSGTAILFQYWHSGTFGFPAGPRLLISTCMAGITFHSAHTEISRFLHVSCEFLIDSKLLKWCSELFCNKKMSNILKKWIYNRFWVVWHSNFYFTKSIFLITVLLKKRANIVRVCWITQNRCLFSFFLEIAALIIYHPLKEKNC